MTRVILYARYSSDNQNVASITDQFRLCREHAEREDWMVVATYQDAAISGASVTLRPGMQALLQEAQAGRFDVVLAEALDRVSRDQADVATLIALSLPDPPAQRLRRVAELGRDRDYRLPLRAIVGRMNQHHPNGRRAYLC